MTTYKNVVAEDGYVELEYVEATIRRRCDFCNKFVEVGEIVAVTHDAGWEDHPACVVRRRRRDGYAKWNTGNPIVNGHTQ